MTKTVDLERSKRLKELGWKQDNSEFYWYENEVWGSSDLHHKYRIWNLRDHVSAPTAGEMIEWLLGHFFIHITDTHVEVADQRFSTKDGLCNALADAVIWVLERKGV